MDPFIRRQNIQHFLRLLENPAIDEKKREHILKLLAEEQQKQRDAGDKI
jgi:hypothetical protein